MRLSTLRRLALTLLLAGSALTAASADESARDGYHYHAIGDLAAPRRGRPA